MTNEAVSRDATDLFVDAYGSTRVAALRQIYGNTFASGIDGRKTLAEVVGNIEPGTLQRLVRDHQPGQPRNASFARSR